MVGTESKTVYPLDKNRKLLHEKSEIDPSTGAQIIHKTFRVFADDGDFVDIEMEERMPVGVIRTKDGRRIVAQEKNDLGHLHKLILADEKGELNKEYFVDQEYLKKRKNGDSTEESTKRSKTEDDVTISPLMKMFLTMKVEDLQPSEDRKIFVAYRHELAKDVFKGLVTHGFLSCPVLNNKNMVHYGFIDFLDFVNFFVGAVAAEHDLPSPPGNELWSLMEQQSAFQDKKVKDIMMASPLGFRNPFHPILMGYSLFSAVEVLAKGDNIQRVPIINSERKLINVITQSQVLSFIADNLGAIGNKKERKIGEISKAFGPIEQVGETELAIEAFKRMYKKNVTAVGVIDKEGRLVGNISTKDLKAIDLDGKWLSRMFLTCPNYIFDLTQSFPNDKRPAGPVTVTRDDTLETAIRKIAENKIHRVYIVDDHNKPLGVLGLKEILEEVISLE